MQRVFNWEPSDKLFEHPDWTDEEVQEYTAEWGTSHKPGCRPRISKAGEWCPMASERIVTIPRGEWETILADENSVRLRPWIPVVLDQDGVGSCATESATGAVMLQRSFTGQEFTLLNPWFIYHTTSGGRDGGSNIDSNLRFVRENGIAPEAIWPRSKGWRAKPTAEAYEAAKQYRIIEFYDIQTVEEFGSALLLGFPVVYGRRGHSILAVDVVNKNEFRMLNSWGNWGDNGTAVERFSGINWGYGAWAVRTTISETVEPTVKMASELPPLFEQERVIVV